MCGKVLNDLSQVDIHQEVRRTRASSASDQPCTPDNSAFSQHTSAVRLIAEHT